MARVVTPGTLQPGGGAGRPSHEHHFILNTDGKHHPRENAGSMIALTLGAAAFILSFFSSAHIAGSWLGLLGVVVGLWSQLVSATTAERVVNVFAIGLAAVGLLFGLAHGGLY